MYLCFSKILRKKMNSEEMTKRSTRSITAKDPNHTFMKLDTAGKRTSHKKLSSILSQDNILLTPPTPPRSILSSRDHSPYVDLSLENTPKKDSGCSKRNQEEILSPSVENSELESNKRYAFDEKPSDFSERVLYDINGASCRLVKKHGKFTHSPFWLLSVNALYFKLNFLAVK